MKSEDVKYLVIHCADTKPSMDIGKKEIDRWHRKRGFNGCGYHFIIRRDGKIEEGRPVTTPGAHALPHNRVSLGICLVGGQEQDSADPEDNFAAVQMGTLLSLLLDLKTQFPNAAVVGHRDLNKGKACPSFDAKSWWACNRGECDCL